MARSERVIGVKGVCSSLKEHMGRCRDEYTTRRIRCGAYVRGDKAGAARAALSCGHHVWRQSAPTTAPLCDSGTVFVGYYFPLAAVFNHTGEDRSPRPVNFFALRWAGTDGARSAVGASAR